MFVRQGEEPSIQPIRVQEAVQRNKRSRHMCEPCDKVIIGDLEWTGTLSAGVSLFSHSFIIIHIFHRIFMKPRPPAAQLFSSLSVSSRSSPQVQETSRSREEEEEV